MKLKGTIGLAALAFLLTACCDPTPMKPEKAPEPDKARVGTLRYVERFAFPEDGVVCYYYMGKFDCVLVNLNQ